MVIFSLKNNKRRSIFCFLYGLNYHVVALLVLNFTHFPYGRFPLVLILILSHDQLKGLQKPNAKLKLDSSDRQLLKKCGCYELIKNKTEPPNFLSNKDYKLI